MLNKFSYMEYMDESVEIETKKMMAYIEAAVKNSYYYRDNMQVPYIEPTLNKLENREKIIKFTGEFIDSHSEELFAAGPMKMFTFGDKEVSFLYELFGLTENKVLEFSNEMFKEAYGGTSLFHIIRNAPHKILITCIAVEAIQKKYDDVLHCCSYLMGFSEYPLMFRTFWRLSLNEDIMNYTIEHLPNKFKLKKIKTLLALLKYDMDKIIDLCKGRLETGLDFQYVDFIFRCRNQIKSTFKKLRNEYEKNYLNNSTQHNKAVKMDDGNLADQDGHAANISNMIENVYTKISSNGVNLAIAKIAADGNQVDKDNVISFLNQIYSSKNNRMYKYIENIITSYFSKNPTNTSLNSGEFLKFGLSLYRSIGTSKDPIYQEIRSILNIWLYDIIKINEYYQNKGTIINYTRAIFNYMIIVIQSS